MGLPQNYDLLFVGIVLAANGILGFTVFLSNNRSITNRAFFVFVISTIPWGILNYFIFQPVQKDLAIWILRAHVFFSVLYCFFLFRLFFVFPNEKKSFPRFYYFFIVPVVIFVAGLTLSPFVFKEIVQFSITGGIARVDNGQGIIIFGITVVSLILYSIYLVLKKLIKLNSIYKSQVKLLLAGVVVTFSLHILFNFLFPVLLDNSKFSPFGSFFIFPFIIFTSYAILRHKLFNVRVASTALLVFALSIVSFIEVTQADNLVFIIYRSAILFFILVFGIILIRSVLREVRQREQITKMAQDVRRAYEIEKKAKEQLEQLDKIKDQFLMTTQHNLRTPLTSIMGYTDLLLNGDFGKQNKKTTEVIKKFQILTGGMIKMVNDFLDMAQFQLGRSVVDLKPGVDLVKILEDIILELGFKAESKNIHLNFQKISDKIEVKADREKLKAALFNIVDNSIKYTQEGSVDVVVKKQDKITISVTDTGIGIAKDRLDTIFEKMFDRGEEAKKITTVGTGIGLYLSGQIIRAHNGKVWVKSDGEQKGSVFYVQLPLAK